MMTRARELVGGGILVAVVAGCSLLPEQLQPPSSTSSSPRTPEVEGYIDTFDLMVNVRVVVGDSDRSLQYNGPALGYNNDLASLIVGIFDYGTTSVPSLGYLYKGNYSSGATPTVAEITSTTAPYIFYATGGIKTKIGSTCSGCVNSSMVDKTRRYLIRDYQTGTGWSSATTAAKFKNIPLADGTLHNYMVFAAAYNGEATGPQLLGYAEAKIESGGNALPNANTANVDLTGSLQLDLKLNESILGPTYVMTEAPTLSPYIPAAGD